MKWQDMIIDGYGQVLDDGPPPTHKRYRTNAAAIKFVKQ